MIEGDGNVQRYYAHYLLLHGGSTVEALKMYKKHDGKTYNEEEDTTWREVILKDFEEYMAIDDYKEKLEQAKMALGWD